MRTLAILVIAFLAASLISPFLTGILWSFGLPMRGAFMLIPWALVFVAAVVLGGRLWPRSPSASYPPGFNPSYAHDHIAIDAESGKLWLRDVSGQTAVLDKRDVLRWNHSYRPLSGEWIDNRLEIEVRDLARPKYTIRFKRHGDSARWNMRKNVAECEEWQARLGSWING